MSFLVHHPGTQSLLVDLGRPCTRSLGIPVGGAADRTAFLLGNALVGNGAEAVGLEITLLGPRLEATEQHAGVVLGADFTVLVNQRHIPLGKTFVMQPGDTLTFQPPRRGLRAYFCVPGGFDSPFVLGSRSAWQALMVGERLECASSMMWSRYIASWARTWEEPTVLRLLPGSHAEEVGQEILARQEYKVQAASNRMGLRLHGAQPLRRMSRELLSAPVCPGTVQVTHDGQPVVLGCEAQTIGGYPRAAHVIAADLDKLAQLRPGAMVRFCWVDLPSAQAAWREHRDWLQEWLTRLLITTDHKSASEG